MKKEYKEDKIKTEETKKEKEIVSFSPSNSSMKLFAIIIFFVFISLWAFTIKDSGNLLNNDPLFNKEKENGNSNNENKYEDYSKIITDILTKPYEFIYTIEPDNLNEYFYLRGSTVKEKTLYYKEYKDKGSIYYKKGVSNFIPGVKTWKKVIKPLSYEGYDNLLYIPLNLYNILNESESNEVITDENNIKKVLVKTDINNLIKMYNSTVEETKANPLLPEKEVYLNFYMYDEKEHLIITVDLKDYYKEVYNKEYTNIIYTLDFSKVGNTNLDNVDSMDFSEMK